MPQDGRLLEGFVEFLERAGAQRITTELALAWARIPVNAHPHTWRQRLTVARGFARHLATIDPASEVPPIDLLPGHRPRIAPYIYSDEEIASLMAAARELRPPLRAARHETLIGLLGVTGCRPRGGTRARPPRRRPHPRRAARARGQTEQAARGPAAREHGQRASCLRRSARRSLPDALHAGVFISARGRRMARAELNQTFTKLIGKVGLEGRGTRVRPRPHDLRHAFAVHTLLDWYRAGEDIDRRMPLLSTFLGHTDPASTYWYLEAVPELLELIGRRLEQLPGVLS